MRFTDKVAAVTGAARGLGETVARAFAAEGAAVVVADIDAAGAAGVADSIAAGGGRAVAHAMDVTSAADADAMVQAAVAAYGSLDVLVANAAVFGSGANVADIDEATWERTLRVNLTGSFLCARAAIHRMRDQPDGGSIVFVSSLSGMLANEHQADYNASKHGVIGLARCIALDCRNWAIRANVVAPTGMSGTDMMALTDPVNVAPYAAQTAFARLARTSEVAAAVLFLASEEASFVTGAVLPVDGGAHAWQPSGRQLREGAEAFLAAHGDTR